MTRLFLLLLFFIPALAQADLQPGNWEMSVTTQFEGAPNAMGPVVQTQCFTAADVRDPHKMLGSAASGCEIVNRRDTGSEFSFELSCSGQLQMQGSGRARYTPTTMQADIELKGSAGGQRFATRSRISGRRLGAC
jgi:hypothetical protein